MSKSQNKNMRHKRMQGNMTPQNVTNHTIEDLMDSEGDESPLVRRMMIRMFNELTEELKEDIQKQLNESKRTQTKISRIQKNN
jgi:hypothetical protein